MGKKKLELVLMMILVVCTFFFCKEKTSPASSNKSGKQTVVIDVGHGGDDPGKVGIGGVLEKELNLEIAKKLQKCLEKEGIYVVLTREKDEGLYQTGAANKKVQDMQNRCKLIEEINPDCTVSIHQNSYTDSAVCGPQVFYFTHSVQAQQLAEELQNCLNEDLAIENPRVQKENSTYYILKRSTSVTVIVECGFITNPVEAKLLAEENYQQKVVEAICRGITLYLDKSSEV